MKLTWVKCKPWLGGQYSPPPYMGPARKYEMHADLHMQIDVGDVCVLGIASC